MTENIAGEQKLKNSHFIIRSYYRLNMKFNITYSTDSILSLLLSLNQLQNNNKYLFIIWDMVC